MEDVTIGTAVIDKETKFETTVTNRTSNSFEVFLKKKTDEGVNANQWFTQADFVKRFTIKQ